MIGAGFETVDPITKTRSVLLQGTEEMDGRGWVIEVHCPEGAPSVIPEHLHRTWSETFEVLQGSGAYKLGGQEHAIKAGETVHMPPGVTHVHPWNTGSGEVVYRQTDDFRDRDPDAVHDVLGAFATINGLAREGRVGKKGLPKNPFQLAATLRTLAKHDGFDAKLPVSVQRFVGATLGCLAEVLGYRGADPRYLG